MGERVRIQLSETDRKELKRFSTTGKRSVRLVNRAKMILALDESEGRKRETFAEIANRIGVSRQTVNNVKNEFLAAENISKFLRRKKRETPPVAPKVTGEVEARIIALACSEVPEGRAKWTLRLLADKSVELGYVNSLHHTTVGRLLKKRN